ncbi:MAG TPA: hypothetical protein DD666_00890 [Advenella kashmirensis]|uniref:Uncharacterized protein n=1 Tax=Advenella kashmirensis TaxID=310575 RepID=A0A356LAC7_9BURK|nr:hypothetical protein [Advenella kashmirensis]
MNILTILSGLKWYALAAVLAAGAAYGYGVIQYRSGHAAAEQERVVSDLKQYKQAANDLLTASQKAQTVLDSTQAKFSTFTEAYQNEMRINPIDCVGTDGRLRSILDLYPSTSARRND